MKRFSPKSYFKICQHPSFTFEVEKINVKFFHKRINQEKERWGTERERIHTTWKDMVMLGWICYLAPWFESRPCCGSLLLAFFPTNCAFSKLWQLKFLKTIWQCSYSLQFLDYITPNWRKWPTKGKQYFPSHFCRCIHMLNIWNWECEKSEAAIKKLYATETDLFTSPRGFSKWYSFGRMHHTCFHGYWSEEVAVDKRGSALHSARMSGENGPECRWLLVPTTLMYDFALQLYSARLSCCWKLCFQHNW